MILNTINGVVFCPEVPTTSKAKPVIYRRDMLEQGVNKLRNLFPGFWDIREGVTLRRLGCSNSENPIHIGTPLPMCQSLDE